MTAWNIIQVVVCFHNCDPFYVKFLPLILLNVSRSNDLMFLSQYRFPDPSALAFLLVVSFVDVDNQTFFCSIPQKRTVCNIISLLSVDYCTFYIFFTATSESSSSLVLFSVTYYQKFCYHSQMHLLWTTDFFFLFVFSYPQIHPTFHQRQHCISTCLFFSVKCMNELVLSEQKSLGKSTHILHCLRWVYAVRSHILTIQFQ